MLARLSQLLRGQRGRVYQRVAESELAHAHSRSGASCALLSVQGMTCSACSSAVESALRAMSGVTKVDVNLLRHSAEVHFKGDAVSADNLVTAVEEVGFDCRLQSVYNVDEDEEDRPQVARLHVGGMTCGACSGAVERGLTALTGVQHAAVSLTQHEAEVTYIPSIISAEALVAEVGVLGFECRLISTAGQESASLAVQGMTCSACSSAVERALLALPGVTAASVNAMTGKAQVSYNPTNTGPRAFLDAISAAGFEGSLLDEQKGGRGAAEHEEELANWRQLLHMALVFTIPVFMLAMVLPMMPGTEAVLSASVMGFRCDELLKWALATPVQFWIGWRFHKGAWKALRRGVANMDVLVALGTDASYFYSVISILHHRFVQHDAMHYTPTDFFETCAMLITVVILGKYLECAAKGKTSAAIQALLALAPESATLVELDDDGHVVSEDVISSRLVHQGELLKVLPGGRIPADGELYAGCSYINEAMITGESQPVLKQKGDTLIGGTINTGNALIMQATRVGADTVLSQIVRLVEHAQLSKAPIQAYADKVASMFVPVVVMLACLTWLLWFVAGTVHAYPESWLPMGHTHFLFALLFGIAVLVIACPCALGLATPTAVMVGTGVGAQLGILIKGGEALERGNNVNTVIFDKTGTLTLGRPQVMEAAVFSKYYTLQQVCELAAAAEACSEHPLARAVLEFTEARLADDPAAQHITSWSIDSSGSSTSASSAAGSAAHAPSTPTYPQAQQPHHFMAAYSLDEELNSGVSSPSGRSHHHHHQQQQLLHKGGSSGSSSNVQKHHSGIQLVEVAASTLQRQLSGSTNTKQQQQQQGGANGAADALLSPPAGWSSRSTPSSPAAQAGYKQHSHAAGGAAGSGAPLHVAVCEGGGVDGRVYGRWSQSGACGGGSVATSPACTPRHLKHLLAAGLLRVSEVQNHPGMGVTTVIPDLASALSHAHKISTSGSPRHSTPGGGSSSTKPPPLKTSLTPTSGSKGNSSSSGELRLAIGNRLLMSEQGVALGPQADAFMREHEGLGQTCVLVGINGHVVAALAIADPLKPEAKGVVAALHQQGIQVHLLTGDNKTTAGAIAKQLAIPSCAVSAEVLPAGKAGVVRELQASGRVVAMVGDGVNDSPALAAADVGVAIGSGTDIAVEAANYVLMRDNLEQVLVALDLSKKTFRRIQQNFCWAMIYNVIMIPIAAGVLYPQWRVKMPPWVAGGCMVFSSVSVVLSSLLLYRYKPPQHLMPRHLVAVKVQP